MSWWLILVSIAILCGLFVLFFSSPKKRPSTNRPLSVCFLHPDLGIGGAEQLIVDAAVGLQAKGHKVTIYTSYHNKNRCIEATRDGTLDVREHGNWLPQHTKGSLQLVKALVRFLWVSLVVLREQKTHGKFDVLFVDQISATIPLLKFSGLPVVFYCHFPDLLLSKPGGLLKKLYRYPFNFLEEQTTASAHVILANSEFTKGIFKETFTSLKVVPKVLYPCVDIAKELKSDKLSTGLRILSINRFERKKNIKLAIDAFSCLSSTRDYREGRLELIIAGGLDDKIKENVEYFAELQDHVTKLGLQHVQFRPNITDEEKPLLIAGSLCLLYTPENEHFGIVPLEAGSFGTATIACNSGGPRETIVDKKTGFLVPSDAKQWGAGLLKLVEDPALAIEMGKAARARVASTFSRQKQAEELEKVLREAVQLLAK